MEENQASKLIPTANIQATVHHNFPTDKISYIDHSIEKIEPCVIYPESTDLNELSSIEFVIHESAGLYIDLTSIKLEVKLQIRDADGVRDGIEDETQVYFIDNLLSSLFPIRKIYINNYFVETQNHGAHMARVKHLMDTPNELIKNRGKPIGIFPIEKARMGSAITAGMMLANLDRKTFTKQGIIHLKGYLDLDISTVNKWLLDLCTLRVVLEPASNAFCINALRAPLPVRYPTYGDRSHPYTIY